jgi:hypothetical protein
LSLYWATKNDIKQLDANGNSGSEWAIVNGKTDAEKRSIQTALFRGAGKNLKPDGSVSLISQVLIGEEGHNTYANTIKKVLDQLDIPNKASAGNHYNHFHLYFKPPAPVQFGTQNLLAQADFPLTGEGATATDFSVASPLILAAAPTARVVKYDKIANDCLLASIINGQSDHPIMVATGQYAHNYEAIQKLKPAKIEVVRNPIYGILTPRATVTRDGKEVPSDTYFELKSTNPNYLGPDLAEYAVELKNGKRVLVRTHIYWVNEDSDFINRCPPSKLQMQEMREIQKRKSSADASWLSKEMLAWMDRIELDGAIAAAYNANLSMAELGGSALAQTVGTGATAQITLDTTAAGHGWYIDYIPYLNEEYLPTSNPLEWIAKPGSAAEGKMDLLTVLLHEYGHALGLEHTADAHSLMTTTLQPGTRRLPSAEELDLMAGLLGLAKETGNASPVPYDPFSRPGAPLPMTMSLAAFVAARQRRSSLSSALTQFEVVANPKLTNPQFADSQGWSSTGDVAIASGAATLKETATTQTRLNQAFVIGPNDRFLSFTLSGIALDDVSNAPDDAFEVALIDANTGLSLLGGTGLTHNDAILNLQADGTEYTASGVTTVRNADGSRTVLVDLAGTVAGTVVNLSFDLIGFGRGVAACDKSRGAGSKL